MSDTPTCYDPTDVPLCSKCRQLELGYLDPCCPGCDSILRDERNTNVAQIFAVLRQWIPQTQLHVESLINEILKRGAHVNDRDKLSGMTLLHFACKSGAKGMGDAASASRIVQHLVSIGADPSTKCSWSRMNALHYSVFFDVFPILKLLLSLNQKLDVNASCPGYDDSTPLHIAASNLCSVEIVNTLLEHGADPNIKNSLGFTPKECVPDPSSLCYSFDVQEHATALTKLLSEKRQPAASSMTRSISSCGPHVPVGQAMLKSLGLSLGSKVVVGGEKVGVLRFMGTTEFALGIWAGVELETPDGKHDGTVNGHSYFKCKPNYGIFVKIEKISKLVTTPKITRKPSLRRSNSKSVTHPKVDLSKITSKVETGLVYLKSPVKKLHDGLSPITFDIGDRVNVHKRGSGTIKFMGKTKFSEDILCGVHLDFPSGKHNGVYEGEKYFDCDVNRGIFVSPFQCSILSVDDQQILPGLEFLGERISGMDSSLSENSTKSCPSPKSPTPDFIKLNKLSFSRNSHTRSSFRARASPSHNASHMNGKTNRSAPTSPTLLRKKDDWLVDGVQVLINGGLGTIKYKGPVEFANGIWIGVELKAARGKNDGSVNGKRYFTCKPNYGLLVRPHKITVRGINGALLI